MIYNIRCNMYQTSPWFQSAMCKLYSRDELAKLANPAQTQVNVLKTARNLKITYEHKEKYQRHKIR